MSAHHWEGIGRKRLVQLLRDCRGRPLADTEDDKFSRPNDGYTDLRNHLSEFSGLRRIGFAIALDVERLSVRGSEKRAVKSHDG